MREELRAMGGNTEASDDQAKPEGLDTASEGES